MSCKCQDTESKRCHWEHPSDSWNEHLKSSVKRERKATRRRLKAFQRRYITDHVGFAPPVSHQGPFSAPWLHDSAQA